MQENKTAILPDGGIHADLKKKCDFLSNYAATLLGCGATCVRIEKNAGRMASVFGTQINLTILPSHVLVTLWDEKHLHSYHNMIKPAKSVINYELNTRLSKLSWEVADHGLSIDETLRRYEKITSEPTYNQYAVMLMASVANASFCRLFDGDAVSMCIVFAATMAGYLIKILLGKRHIDARMVTFFAAFASTLIAAQSRNIGLCGTPDVAIATSILYLIPGIPFINCMSDLMAGHYVSAYSRFVHAALIVICLSAGLCCGMALMKITFF